jgi:hypothetical protein
MIENLIKNEGFSNECEISKPYIYKSLTIFLLCGEDKIKGKSFWTLQEAMEQEKVIVHETGNVNKLEIENLLLDEEVFIQSGDIVKGGKQDRVFAFDFIVPANSGKLPIDAFCVEQSRWNQRGGESSTRFTTSSDRAVTRDLNISIKHTPSQSAVWNTIGNTQRSLTGSLGRNVQSRQSESSLQLTLEDPNVKEAVAEYISNFSGVIDNHFNVVGYVVVINGKITNSDTYFCNELFRKLWPKLLKAAAVEAIIHKQENISKTEINVDEVKEFLANKPLPKVSEKQVSTRVKMTTQEFMDKIRFDTMDLEKQVCVHTNFVTR